MELIDIYDKNNIEHKDFLLQQAKKLEKFTAEELKELSDAMHYHGLRILELFRAMRNYVQNPFGKYYTSIGEGNGTRKTVSKDR